MLFQPTNITPSSLSGVGEGTVDTTQSLTVTWRVNGNSPLLAYQIIIYQNDSDSTQKYDSGKVVLTEPFYGVNYAGEVQYFSSNPISASVLASAGIVNGYLNGYKFIITQWWSETDSVTQTSASYFITRNSPTLTISSIPNPLTVRAYSFTAAYSQAQGDAIDWVKWTIIDGLGNTLLDTGQIAGTSQLRVDFDGFLNNNTYSVNCSVQTMNGAVASDSATFTTSYSGVISTGLMTACRSLTHNAVNLSWGALRYIPGSAEGSYTISDNQLSLADGSSVTWNTVTGLPLNFPVPWSVVWRGIALQSQDGKLFTINGVSHSLSVYASGTQISVMLDGVSIGAYEVAVSSYEWLVVGLTPTRFYIRKEEMIGGTYPSDSLYPAEYLYPGNDYLPNSAYYTFSIAYTQFPITSIVLTGEQTCEYAWITNAELTETQASNILTINEYEPAYDSTTMFLANFNDGLNAGNITGSEDVVGFAIYRRTGNNTYLEQLCRLPLTSTYMADFGAASQNSYTYYCFTYSESAMSTTPVVSNLISPVIWDWAVLECETDTFGNYHVINEFRFSNNVETSSIGNGNTPNIMRNFTQYPTRQPITYQAKSGVLMSLIGKVENNAYIETNAYAEAIYALSTSTNPKFLKNRSGNIWRIETSEAISMQFGDNYPQQPRKMSLPWVEVGTVNASIVAIPGDAILNT